MAVKADCTIELMSPVMPWTEAADWTAKPNEMATEVGMYREINRLAAEENWASFVLGFVSWKKAVRRGGTYSC